MLVRICGWLSLLMKRFCRRAQRGRPGPAGSRMPACLPACLPARLPACPPARLPACPPAVLQADCDCQQHFSPSRELLLLGW